MLTLLTPLTLLTVKETQSTVTGITFLSSRADASRNAKLPNGA